MVEDVTAFAIGAGSGSGARNESGRPYQRYLLLRRHSLLEPLLRRFTIDTANSECPLSARCLCQ